MIILSHYSTQDPRPKTNIDLWIGRIDSNIMDPSTDPIATRVGVLSGYPFTASLRWRPYRRALSRISDRSRLLTTEENELLSKQSGLEPLGEADRQRLDTLLRRAELGLSEEEILLILESRRIAFGGGCAFVGFNEAHEQYGQQMDALFRRSGIVNLAAELRKL